MTLVFTSVLVLRFILSLDGQPWEIKQRFVVLEKLWKAASAGVFILLNSILATFTLKPEATQFWVLRPVSYFFMAVWTTQIGFLWMRSRLLGHPIRIWFLCDPNLNVQVTFIRHGSHWYLTNVAVLRPDTCKWEEKQLWRTIMEIKLLMCWLRSYNNL